MTEQSSVINAELDNNQTNLVETNPNVEQTIAETVETPVAEVIAEVQAEIPAEVAPEITETPAEVPTAAIAEEAKAEVKKESKPRQEISQEVLDKLKALKESGNTISAKVEDRVRGGLKLSTEGAPLFLPTSHFSLKANPTEDELIQSVGAVLEVEILEINEELPAHKRNIIVSRKRLLEEKFWNEIKEGDIVEGPVTSITTFGIFLDIGGFEGLVHISRMSRKRVESTKSFAKKGEKFRAAVVEVDRSKKRIGLSIAKLEPSPWDLVAEKFPLNSVQKGTVKRFVDFGAFVELGSGIQGLLRNQDLSWNRRITNPKDFLTLEQEIEVQVVAINPEKEMLSLSYKATQPNPWTDIDNIMKVGDEMPAVVKQVLQEGVIVTISDIDGFMPKSKMGALGKTKKIPYKKGESMQVRILDLVPAQQSLIVEPKDAPQVVPEEREERTRRRPRNDDRPFTPQPLETTTTEVGSFSFTDMLGEDALKKLFGN
jgi:small subunit ribosomal protein S1